METKKTFVLDTSVLLSAPNALTAFEEHDVVIPLVVIKELESKRHDPTLGHPARAALRALEELRVSGDGDDDIRHGVRVGEQGGTVRIEINHVHLQDGFPQTMREDRSNDTRILAVAFNLHKEGKRVVLVSKDLPMRILAATIGLQAQEFLNEQVVVDKPYTGLETLDVTDEELDVLYSDRKIPVPTDILTNTGLILQAPNGGSALARVASQGYATLVQNADREDVFGLKGRSAEQRVAIAHLLDENIGVVSLGGVAGSGKTVLAIAAGLEQVLEKSVYKKIVVFRPLFAVGGQELGYLPGTAEEKMNPWAAAVYDALSAIGNENVVDEVIDRQILEVLPLTHIRGRSLHDSFVVVDEAQSLEKPVLLTALTRMGTNSKIVLTHDVSQRDNLRVGRHDGIAAVVERLKGEQLFAHVAFTKSERSPVAAMATRLLDWEV